MGRDSQVLGGEVARVRCALPAPFSGAPSVPENSLPANPRAASTQIATQHNVSGSDVCGASLARGSDGMTAVICAPGTSHGVSYTFTRGLTI